MSEPRPTVRVTEVGEYIRYRSCERRFKLGRNDWELAKEPPFATRSFNTLDPVLQEAGRKREDEWESSLKSAGLEDLTRHDQAVEDSKGMPWNEVAAQAQRAVDAGERAYGREVELAADIEAFRVEGRADFVLILWRDGRPRLRIVECKASRRDHTYHRVQVALYGMVLRRMLRDNPLEVGGVTVRPEDVECVVARIDEGTNEGYAILELDPLDLSMEEADLRRLLAHDGSLRRIATTDLDDLSYQLDQKCDGCVFSVHCFPESARQRRVELVGAEPSTVRTLQDVGVASIDDLAALDPDGPEANRAREAPGFTENIEVLQQKARARRSTLPRGDEDPDNFQVRHLPHVGQGQLPEHEVDDQRLVRVYLSVDYDYTENRVGALSAHVTTSDGQLRTGMSRVNGSWQPEPEVREAREVGRDGEDRPVYEERELEGTEVIRFKPSQWTGDLAQDTGAERDLIQGFLLELIDAIAGEAGTDWAPIHLYVWSRSEVTQLVEACSRVGSGLLGHLRELLGCRETLEQLIYSCLQDEVDHRYGLGWTGRGLSVATSLRWYGRRYHWVRRIGGTEVDLERAFTQDIFDFKTTLALDGNGGWGDPDDDEAPRHRFEIRSRFHDSLPAPYWRAYWRTLPRPEDVSDSRLKGSIRRYNEAARPPSHLREYLRARVHALRWIEESISFKNPEITKPAINIPELRDFSLGVDDVARAAVDFLQLDQHVKVTDWIARHLVPPISRVPTGRTVPVRDVVSHGGNQLTATISLDGFGIVREELSVRCPYVEDSFVRVVPRDEDPYRGQTFRQLTAGGRTCKIRSIDWETGEVVLTLIPASGTDRYLLTSVSADDPETLFEHATLDESVSDFVAGKVERRLRSGRGGHVYRWLDPEGPAIPPQTLLDPDEEERLTEALSTLRLGGDHTLAEDQQRAILEGLSTRVQLLQGPPGTGKTTTTAAATLARVAARRSAGDIVLVATSTHTAVDNLLQRLRSSLDDFSDHMARSGITLPAVNLAKVHSSSLDPIDCVDLNLRANACARDVSTGRRNAVLVIGGTVSALLKMARKLSDSAAYRGSAQGFHAPVLIVDEASMMVMPHFLALASLVEPDGELMLTGDHRQLAPIMAHDWEREDRPPTVLYQPFASAYQAVLDVIGHPDVPEAAARRSALSQTFRLPPLVCDLIARLYRLDDIELEGLPRGQEQSDEGEGSWESVWRGATGLYLVLHSERQSKQSNPLEAEVIERVLEAGEPPDGSVAIVTPHRAQRTLLRSRLTEGDGPVDLVDTVERLQGGERPTVIVSGTASDPAAISTNVEFILDLNRSNVAFSRAQERLTVVCSEALLDHIAPEVEHYQAAMLWKSLRALCSRLVATETVDGHTVRIYTPPVDPAADA
jgi:hypothetical protein